jgi:ABC-type sugar transport system permease subunit
VKGNDVPRLSLGQRKAVLGYAFISPFLIGFAFFVLYPFVQSVVFSFSKLQVSASGFTLDFVGWANYRHSLMVDADYKRMLFETIVSTVADIPAVITFSFLVASILNQNFRGRLLARLVFFLPVVLNAEAVLRMEESDYLRSMMARSSSGGSAFVSGTVENLVRDLVLPGWLVEFVLSAVERIPHIITASGIPILIFLAGLQSVPASWYEAADIEGATAWERFWKITFPLMSPLFLTNVVFITIQSFTSYDNALLSFIKGVAWGGAGYGASVAMSWIYFGAIALVIGLIIAVMSRQVFYMQR